MPGVLAASFLGTHIIASSNLWHCGSCTYAAIFLWKGGTSVDNIYKLLPILNIIFPVRC
jgi:hypothetical protein